MKWVGQWEEPLKGRSPVREEPLEGGAGLGGANEDILLPRLALERRESIFWVMLKTAGGRRGGR